MSLVAEQSAGVSDRPVVDVDTEQLDVRSDSAEAFGDSGEKSSVAARRIDDAQGGATALDGQQRHDCRHHHIDEFSRRRIETAQLLRLRCRHDASVWFSDVDGVNSRYMTFDRDQWAALRAATPLTLREDDLERLRGINDAIDLDEVVAAYLPLTRLLNLYVTAWQDLARVSSTFLGTMAPRVPYVIGIAGSVAVGKSTFARILQALLSRWPDHPNVDLVTTDGFLYPNAVLENKGLMERKGFPESYDTRRLLHFLREVKSGARRVEAPVYSHVVYDIIAGETVTIERPDILILEGLNVLQVTPNANEFVSDYFDFSIYVDADEADILSWFVARFMTLRESVFRDPDSFFRHYSELSDEEAVATATQIWHEINGRNLRENIEPTRERASLILRKAADHRIERVDLHKR